MSIHDESAESGASATTTESTTLLRALPWVVGVVSVIASYYFYSTPTLIPSNDAEIFYGFIFAGLAVLLFVYGGYKEYRRRTRLS